VWFTGSAGGAQIRLRPLSIGEASLQLSPRCGALASSVMRAPLRTALLVAVSAVLALGSSACGKDDKSEAGEKPSVSVPSGAAPTELQKTDLIVGDGADAVAGKKITVHYVGVSFATKKQFDASWDSGEPFSFVLGQGGVIKGWDEGVPGMKVGGRRQLVIPPELAYGDLGSPPVIGPNETLVFVVDLLSVS
jgi:peptidylprolyl isomerase